MRPLRDATEETVNPVVTRNTVVRWTSGGPLAHSTAPFIKPITTAQSGVQVVDKFDEGKLYVKMDTGPWPRL